MEEGDAPFGSGAPMPHALPKGVSGMGPQLRDSPSNTMPTLCSLCQGLDRPRPTSVRTKRHLDPSRCLKRHLNFSKGLGGAAQNSASPITLVYIHRVG